MSEIPTARNSHLSAPQASNAGLPLSGEVTWRTVPDTPERIAGQVLWSTAGTPPVKQCGQMSDSGPRGNGQHFSKVKKATTYPGARARSGALQNTGVLIPVLWLISEEKRHSVCLKSWQMRCKHYHCSGKKSVKNVCFVLRAGHCCWTASAPLR